MHPLTVSMCVCFLTTRGILGACSSVERSCCQNGQGSTGVGTGTSLGMYDYMQINLEMPVMHNSSAVIKQAASSSCLHFQIHMFTKSVRPAECDDIVQTYTLMQIYTTCPDKGSVTLHVLITGKS